MSISMNRLTSPRGSAIGQPSPRGLAVRRSEPALQSTMPPMGEITGRRRLSNEKSGSEWRQRSNDRGHHALGEIIQPAPKPNTSPVQVHRKISQGGMDVAPRRSQASVSGAASSVDVVCSNDRGQLAQQDITQPAQKPNTSPGQVHRRTSRGGMDAAPKKMQTCSAGSVDVVSESGSFDADIRCAGAVRNGRSCTVWCGERDGSLAIRDSESFAIRTVLPQEQLLGDYVWSILHDDEFVLVGMSSGRLRVYDASTQALLFERIRHTGGIYALACLGEFAYSASNDFTISEWTRGSWEPTNRVLDEHTNQVRCLCTCAGYLVSGGDDHVINVWDLGSTIKTMKFQCDDSVLAIVGVPGASDAEVSQGSGKKTNILWAGDGKGDLLRFDVQVSSAISSFKAHGGAISNLMYQDGYVLSSSVDKMVKVWNPFTQSCLQTFQAHGSYVAGLLPIAIVTQVRLWSFGGDKKIRRWHMERAPDSCDELHQLKEETQHQKRRLSQLTRDYASAKESLDVKHADVEELSTSLKAKEAEWSSKEQQQLDEIARLSAALKAREQAHEETLRDLESARSASEILSREKADLLRDLERTKNECRSEVEKESRARQDAVSALDDVAKQLKQRTIELHELRESSDASGKQQLQNAQKIAKLQEQLVEALEANRSAEKRIQSFEEQELAHETTKLSRLGFVTEVWALHSAIGKIKSDVRGSKVGKAMSDLESCNLQQSIENIHKHSKRIIAKYLTDHEKLHLGAPLAHYEGGHDSPQPLDWSGISEDVSTTRATDVSVSSVDSGISKDAKSPEIQKRKPLQRANTADGAPITRGLRRASSADGNRQQAYGTPSNRQQAYGTPTSRQQAFQPQKRSPRRNSPSSVRA